MLAPQTGSPSSHSADGQDQQTTITIRHFLFHLASGQKEPLDIPKQADQLSGN